jgi:imidazole glycerol-phosphate synthase subunit HisH
MNTSKEIVMVDAGTGNLHSVEQALLFLGAQVRRTSDPADLQPGARIVLPGVGAFGKFMNGLAATGMPQALKAVVKRGDPLLGICVGMQALFETSEEMGQYAGLGILPGQVVRFAGQPGFKVPHTGWNQLTPRESGGPLFAGLSSGCYAYFNHSYYCAPANPEDTSAWTDYEATFTSMVQHENILGVQFHPEKSQQVGLQILANFLTM